jgi:hypothetical protein
MIESVISDLVNNQSLSVIFLKVQAISFYLDNQEFSEWFENENKGYTDLEKIPEYRIYGTSVHANIMTFRGLWKNYNIPVDQIKDEFVKKWLMKVKLNDSISSIESLLENAQNKGYFIKHLPGVAYSEINKILESGCQVEGAWQEISRTAFVNTVAAVKSKLLEFFMKLDKEFKKEINFDVMSEKKVVERIASQTINAGVVNLGSHSTVNANESTIIGGQNNSIVINNESLVAQIKEVAESFEDEKDEVLNELARIITQLDKPTPKTSIISSALQTINGILMGVAGNIATPVVMEGIKHVLSLIGD